eukprot:scaffold2330_cov136-Skeletonema_menzelii.AAC.4
MRAGLIGWTQPRCHTLLYDNNSREPAQRLLFSRFLLSKFIAVGNGGRDRTPLGKRADGDF